VSRGTKIPPPPPAAPAKPGYPERLLTVEELAGTLRVQPTTVRAWAGAGRIRSYKFGHRTLRFRLSEVLEAFAGGGGGGKGGAA
jgi:excisionase family DNA binding protein